MYYDPVAQNTRPRYRHIECLGELDLALHCSTTKKVFTSKPHYILIKLGGRQQKFFTPIGDDVQKSLKTTLLKVILGVSF